MAVFQRYWSISEIEKLEAAMAPPHPAAAKVKPEQGRLG